VARPPFPRSLTEFFRMFPDEEACSRFVVESRWPEGIECPRCGHSRVCPRGDRRCGLECPSCDYTFSATAGTVMHDTKLPLSTWLQAAYLMVTDKRGISAKQLQRDLGLRGYETAYMLLQRLRVAMVNPDREPLSGSVEVDETFLGGVRHGRPGMEAVGKEGGKFIVLGAIEVLRIRRESDWKDLHRPARLRLRHAENLSRRVLLSFVRDVVLEGSAVATDGKESYRSLDDHGYLHRVESTALGMPQKHILEHLHLAFSNLKAWMDGTFHGRVEAKHLQGYLNEFCFRFNRRDNLYAAFQTVLGIAGRVRGPTHEALYSTGPGRFVHLNPHDPGEPFG